MYFINLSVLKHTKAGDKDYLLWQMAEPEIKHMRETIQLEKGNEELKSLVEVNHCITSIGLVGWLSRVLTTVPHCTGHMPVYCEYCLVDRKYI